MQTDTNVSVWIWTHHADFIFCIDNRHNTCTFRDISKSLISPFLFNVTHIVVFSSFFSGIKLYCNKYMHKVYQIIPMSGCTSVEWLENCVWCFSFINLIKSASKIFTNTSNIDRGKLEARKMYSFFFRFVTKKKEPNISNKKITNNYIIFFFGEEGIWNVQLSYILFYFTISIILFCEKLLSHVGSSQRCLVKNSLTRQSRQVIMRSVTLVWVNKSRPLVHISWTFKHAF